MKERLLLFIKCTEKDSAEQRKGLLDFMEKIKINKMLIILIAWLQSGFYVKFLFLQKPSCLVKELLVLGRSSSICKF